MTIKMCTLVAVVFAATLGVIILGGAFFIPWGRVNWGKVELAATPTLTVQGEAKVEQKTQIAQFSAGVTAVNDDKNAAIAEVNKQIEALLASLSTFGIPKGDIKTQNLNVYQGEEQYFDPEESRQKTRPGQWRVSNTIDIKLRDVDRASDLANLLAQSGATNIYGPSLIVDETESVEDGLLEAAVADAREKAEIVSKSSGKTLGEIVSINEGGVSGGGVTPLYEGGGGGGGGGPIEPGTGTVRQVVNVTFELR